MLIKTEIITLKSTPFKEKSKILQVLTKDLGVISLIVNNLSQNNLNSISLCSPFTVSEVVLKKRNSDIYSLKDFNIQEANLILRKDFTTLNVASLMTKAILDSHFPQKKSFNLFILIKTYLKKIPINPDGIYLSFLLKLLNTEGLLNLKTNCHICKKEAEAITNGESHCIEHSCDYSFKFTQEDFKKLFVLCYAKEFSMLKDIEVSNELKQKVNYLFNDLI